MLNKGHNKEHIKGHIKVHINGHIKGHIKGYIKGSRGTYTTFRYTAYITWCPQNILSQYTHIHTFFNIYTSGKSPKHNHNIPINIQQYRNSTHVQTYL